MRKIGWVTIAVLALSACGGDAATFDRDIAREVLVTFHENADDAALDAYLDVQAESCTDLDDTAYGYYLAISMDDDDTQSLAIQAAGCDRYEAIAAEHGWPLFDLNG